MIHSKIPTYIAAVFEADFSKPIETQAAGEVILDLLKEGSEVYDEWFQRQINQLKDRIERKEELGGSDIDILITQIVHLNNNLTNSKEQFQAAIPFVHWEELPDENIRSPVSELAQIPKKDRENVYALAHPLLAGLGGCEWGVIIRAVSAIPKDLREEVCAEVADWVPSDMKKLSNYAQMYQITKMIRELKRNYIGQ